MARKRPFKTFKLDDGREACFVTAHAIQYTGGFIEGGLVRGVEPDDFYIRLHRKGKPSLLWCARRDEMEAFISVISAALYVESITRLALQPKRTRKARK